MRISRLWLINFRNYENTQIEFSDQNLIVGRNGSGKTNILEAIDILTTTKSKIVKGINKCIRHKHNGFIITADFVKDNGEKLQVVFKQEKNITKTIKVQENLLERTSELIGVVNSVIFLPNDIEIIQGAPVVRRKYLDICISQIDKAYYKYLQLYNKVLKQRNELLKAIKENRAAQNSLEVWDMQLIDLSSKIYTQRKNYIQWISNYVHALYQTMGFVDDIKLAYKTDVLYDNEAAQNKIFQQRSYDILTGHTKYGVHADDLEFLINDAKVIEFCSQGQQRLISLALKCAEAKIKQEKLNDAPILLIDDVLLELDVDRLHKIIKVISPESQKIYTVTDTKRFDQELLKSIKQINVEQGKISYA